MMRMKIQMLAMMFIADNTIEPKNQGLQTIIIYRQNEDGTWNYSKGYLQIGSELD